MKPNKPYYNGNFKEELIGDVEEICSLVSSTFGPNGKTVLINNGGVLKSTKDGVSIINSLRFLENDELNKSKMSYNTALALIRDAANKSVKQTGDGTTTTTLLISKFISLFNLYKDELKNINISRFTSDMNNLVNHVEQSLKEGKGGRLYKLELKNENEDTYDMLRNVAKVSVNNDDELAKIVTDAFKLVGLNGVVNIEVGTDDHITIEEKHGISFKSNQFNPYFYEKNSNKLEFENPLIITSSYLGETVEPLIPILEFSRTKNIPLVIISDRIDTKVLDTLILNYRQGALKVIHIKPKGFGKAQDRLLDDISIMMNTIMHNEANESSNIKFIMENKLIGAAHKLIIKGDEVLLLPSSDTSVKKSVENKIEGVLKSIEGTEFYEERKLRLTSSVATIKVGGFTDIEVYEKRDRIEDAVGAVNTALKSGITTGGGSTFYDISRDLSGENGITVDLENIYYKKLSVDFMIHLLRTPIYKLLESSGIDSKDVKSEDIKYPFGFDALNGKFVNLISARIFEPIDVQLTALKTAISIGCTIINSEGVIER